VFLNLSYITLLKSFNFETRIFLQQAGKKILENLGSRFNKQRIRRAIEKRPFKKEIEAKKFTDKKNSKIKNQRIYPGCLFGQLFLYFFGSGFKFLFLLGIEAE